MEDIASATEDMDDEYRVSKNHEFSIYETKLLWSGESMDIVLQEFDRRDADGVSMFTTTAMILSGLKHKNIVSFLGFCQDPYWIFIVTKYETNTSLDKHLSDELCTFSWIEILRICVGVAHGLSYLHYEEGRDYSVIHCNIKSSSILLDDNWEPKICNFGHSIKTPVAHRHRLYQAKYCGTEGYMDAIYKETKGVTQKSDVFSFGVVLFELLFWLDASEATDNMEFLARSHYEQGTLEDLIDIDVWEEMDAKSFKIFSETAYSCLNEQRSQRPGMDQVVRQLEKALEIQIKSQDHKHSPGESKVTSSERLKGKDLQHLKIKRSDIELATNDFHESYCIGSGTYGEVYKAVLHLEGKNVSTIKEDSKGELRKKPTTVAIKRIKSREDKQGEDGFLAEIETLASCRNRNVISLLGYCDEGPERILVYEHASNGSLDNYLETPANRAKLTWAQRIRICLGIARGLHYLHSSTEEKQMIIHRDIKSANILLDKNFEAKIADFGLSRLHNLNENSSTINTIHIAGTEVYWDPEYVNTGKLKKASDVYSVGVVLFEILCGRLAYDHIYMAEDAKGLGPIARRHFNKGTLGEMIDPILKQESDEILFTQNEARLNQESLTTFFKIAYECLAEFQAKRPTMEVVIKELEQALSLQENFKSNLKFSLEDIKLATKNFSENNIIGEEYYWQLYRGEVPLPHANGSTIIIAKRFKDDTGFLEQEFVTEILNLYEYKHKNIVGFVGYCKEKDERVILYENASKGRLDGYLNDVNLTWMKRLKISIDVASGLEFLHGGNVTHDVVVHRNIRTTSILLDGEWNARLVDLGFSVVSSREPEQVPDIECTSCTAFDPQFAALQQANTLTKESDIYSLGVVLFEILCGTSSFVEYSNKLGEYIRSHFPDGKLHERVFEGIKEQIVPQSLATFQEILLQCLHYEREERPTAAQVLMQLKKALEFQEDHEMWEPKLPKDYKKIIQISKTPKEYSMAKKEDLFNMLFEGILLGEGKVWFSVGSNGERNEMISATNFTYKNRRSRKWRPVPKSRFHKVAKMLDISNLKIQVKIKPQFLSLGVNYGVHLVFRFCDPRKSVAKRTYANLKFKKGSKTLHTYFATCREDGWMMIELCRFLNQDDNTGFEFLLESFSRCYCESHDIYIDGIEFRTIDNIKHEEIRELMGGQQLVIKPDLNMEHVQHFSTNFGKEVERFENYDEGGQLFSLNEVNKKKHYMLSAKEVLYESTDVKPFNVLPSTNSRFKNVIELLRQQVFRIKCKIEGQSLSPDTEYTCYIVFKISEKCRGLHCPVIVRDLLKRKNKEKGILYFRSPTQCNVNDTNQVPKERKDGWMEVNVWQFNSTNELLDDCVSINLKLISYEGTMSGLVISSLEFRPM